MPIVSASTTTQTTTEPSGARYVVVRMYDQDGTEYTFSLFLDAATDLAAIIAEREAMMDSALADAEFEQLMRAG